MKTLYLIIFGISALLFVALFFSHLMIAIVPIIGAIVVWLVSKTSIKLIKTKFTLIHLLNEGLVKIQGTITAPKTFTTPYFKQECIGYYYKKADLTYDSESGSEYEKDATIEEEFQDFYLTDATGKIKVIAPRFNLAFLPVKTDTVHSIKYAVDDVRHSERILKNGDKISVMGYAKRNAGYSFEIIEQPNNPIVISNADFESKSRKSFQVFKFILPYLILMYLSVNYFVFFAPLHHWKQNDALIVFGFFGVPILGIISAIIGKKETGCLYVFFSVLGGTLLLTSLLTFPLLCLLLISKTAFYTIVCVWLSVFVCTLLGLGINYKKLADLNE
ncbi:hypothetical protein [Pedobacter ureilyticus]|uniref:RING-type E3 ubiquitin transferase n=1 Tax=Pedobacter ureilyticus TaxID=1393051 RepID=A0ABW9J426_9SPHI|nr:hypothetical protein [Pedobacter helvus]